MAFAEFVIPLNKDELLDATAAKYFVRNVLSSKEIPQTLKDARQSFKEEGPEFILNYFDTYFSVLHLASNLKLDVVSTAYDDLHKAVIALNKNLQFLLEDKDNLNEELKEKYLTILKMLLYLYVNIDNFLLTLIEDNNAMAQNKRLKNLNKNDCDENRLNEKQILLVLNNIMQKSIGEFWSPQLVEELFVSMTAEVAYRVMQCYKFKVDKELQNITFHFLGTLIKNYGQGYTFTIRIIQMIKLYDHLVQCIPEGFQLLVENYNCKGIIHDFTKEITELLSDEKTADDQGTKSCSAVLLELAMCLPSLMMPEIMLLNQYLAHDSYTLRNSILAIITEVLLTVLHKPQLNEDERENRDQFLSILEEHIHDTSGFVRSKVFVHFAKLHEENALPIQKQLDILEKVVFHLNDKVVAVRKNAISCLRAFITHNIYGPDLKLKPMMDELSAKQEKLNKLQEEINNKHADKLKDVENEWSTRVEDIKSCFEKYLEDSEDAPELDIDKNKLNEVTRAYILNGEYKEAFMICKYIIAHEDEFVQIREAMNADSEVDLYMNIMRYLMTDFTKILTTMVGNVTEEDLSAIAELKTSIDYFTNVVNYIKLINSAMPFISNLLEAQSVTDMQAAVDFLVIAYRFNIDDAPKYITEMLKLMQRSEQDRKDAVIKAFKEIYLTTDANNMQEHKTIVVDRLISLCKIVSYENLFNLSQLISCWAANGVLDNNIIDMLWQNFTKNPGDVARASLELLKMASLDRPTIISRNFKLITTIAFKERKNDMLLVKLSCEAICLMGTKKQLLTDENPPMRIPSDDEIWTDLSDILISIFMKKEKFVLGVITAIIRCIYALCSKPDKLCGTIIKAICQNSIADNNQLNCFIIIRLVHLLGETAIRHFHYLDENIYKELKRRNYILQNKKNLKSQAVKEILKSASASVNSDSCSQGDESVLEGAQAEDADAEFILATLECHTVTGGSILSMMSNIIIQICENAQVYNNKILQTCAVTALGRYMIISSNFCKQYIQLFLTILDKSPHWEVKNNILAICSDLLERFPNIIEPWVPKIFERLNDEEYLVQRTTFFIISNLILKDVIRAQSNISQMAIFLVSSETELCDMSKQFFPVLASKGNVLYNILPDIFSYLCGNEKVTQENFTTIMTYLFSLMDKTKYMENLVDRFCIKFRLREDEVIFKNAAFSLNLITYNEKALKRLLENFPIYKHALHQQKVYTYFKNILSTASKDPKAEMKAIVAEIEEKIKVFFDVNDIQPPAKVPSKNTKSNSKTSNKRRKQRNKVLEDSSNESDESPLKNSSGKRKQIRKSAKSETSDSEEIPSTSRSKRNIRSTRKTRNSIQDSD